MSSQAVGNLLSIRLVACFAILWHLLGGLSAECSNVSVDGSPIVLNNSICGLWGGHTFGYVVEGDRALYWSARQYIAGDGFYPPANLLIGQYPKPGSDIPTVTTIIPPLPATYRTDEPQIIRTPDGYIHLFIGYYYSITPNMVCRLRYFRSAQPDDVTTMVDRTSLLPTTPYGNYHHRANVGISPDGKRVVLMLLAWTENDSVASNTPIIFRGTRVGQDFVFANPVKYADPIGLFYPQISLSDDGQVVIVGENWDDSNLVKTTLFHLDANNSVVKRIDLTTDVTGRHISYDMRPLVANDRSKLMIYANYGPSDTSAPVYHEFWTYDLAARQMTKVCSVQTEYSLSNPGKWVVDPWNMAVFINNPCLGRFYSWEGNFADNGPIANAPIANADPIALGYKSANYTLTPNVLHGSITHGAGSLTINAGASCTNSGNVSLTPASLGAADGRFYMMTDCNNASMQSGDSGPCSLLLWPMRLPPTSLSQMRFSNDGITWSDWEPYSAAKSWALSQGDGTKTVSVQFKNASGSESWIVTDSILMDTNAPLGSITINDGAYCTTSTSAALSISAADNMGSIRMRFSDDNANWTSWETYTTSKAWTLPAGDGAKPIYAQFMDDAANIGSANSSIILDNTSPSAPGVPTDAGAFTGSTSVTFNWTAATDAASGVAGYTCRVGTSPGGNDISDGYVGNVLSKTFTGSYGSRYYCRVQAQDAAGNIGNWSAVSDGITVVKNPGLSISAAKSAVNLATVGLDGKVVSAILADRFYVQETNRSAGIMVKPADGMPSGIGVGKLADVGGAVKRDENGECWIDATVSLLGTSSDALPLAITNAALGGGDWDYMLSPAKGQKGIGGAKGLNNIGLLVKTWGKVTYADSSGEFVYIDDGSAINDGNTLGSSGTAVKGIRVYTSDGNNSMSLDQYAVATGISSICTIEGNLARALKQKPAGAAIFGRVGTGSMQAINQIIESPHDYPDYFANTWMVIGPVGTIKLRAHFAQISTQADADILYVSDINYDSVTPYTGTFADCWTDWVTGDTIMLDLTSDEAVTGYGFKMDKYEAIVPLICPVSAVTITLIPGNKTVLTDSKGAFSFSGLAVGQYQLTPSLPGATFDPVSLSVTIGDSEISSGNLFSQSSSTVQ